MSAVDALAVSRVVGIQTQFKDFGSGRVRFLPQRIAVIGQGKSAETYSLDKYAVTSAAQVAARYGFGSPLHLAAMMLFPKNGDGVGSIPVTIYPLEDDSMAVTAAGNLAALGTQTETAEYKIKVSNIEATVVLQEDDTADTALGRIRTAILAVLEMPIIPGAVAAGNLPFDVKWAGESGNDVHVEIDGDAHGIVFTITQPVGGLVNPDITEALEQMGSVWETIVVNCLNYDDTDALDALQEAGETRWGPLEKKPFFAISGTGDAYAVRTVITDARTDDKINALESCPGCWNLPAQIAARAAARIAVKAQNNPPLNYSDKLTGLTPGDDAYQEEWATRDLSVKAGSGTTIVVGDEIEMNDTITMYHPEGEEPPGFRYVVDIVKLQNVIYNCRLIFESEEWKGAPLLPDATPTVNPAAKKPKDAKTALCNLAANLALEAILAESDFTKENMTAVINSTNPKRLDWTYPVKLSGNVEIISGDIYFGFYFG
jgi:phage tail sheath gpL-like